MAYLIDGNNLLGSWGGPRPGGDRRQDVIRRVSTFCSERGASATIVFDGRPIRDGFDEQAFGRVRVLFPPPGGDADTIIRDLVDRARQPSDLIVVTSDKPLYSYVRTRGAQAITARQWNMDAKAPARPPDAEKPEREDDVEGWLKIFGDPDQG